MDKKEKRGGDFGLYTQYQDGSIVIDEYRTVPQWNDRWIRMDRLLRMDTVPRWNEISNAKEKRQTDMKLRILGCKTRHFKTG